MNVTTLVSDDDGNSYKFANIIIRNYVLEKCLFLNTVLIYFYLNNKYFDKSK